MRTLIPTIPRDVARKLGYYVYAYVSPLDDKILNYRFAPCSTPEC